jgi:hypothetical protein
VNKMMRTVSAMAAGVLKPEASSRFRVERGLSSFKPSVRVTQSSGCRITFIGSPVETTTEP